MQRNNSNLTSKAEDFHLPPLSLRSSGNGGRSVDGNLTNHHITNNPGSPASSNRGISGRTHTRYQPTVPSYNGVSQVGYGNIVHSPANTGRSSGSQLISDTASAVPMSNYSSPVIPRQQILANKKRTAALTKAAAAYCESSDDRLSESSDLRTTQRTLSLELTSDESANIDEFECTSDSSQCSNMTFASYFSPRQTHLQQSLSGYSQHAFSSPVQTRTLTAPRDTTRDSGNMLNVPPPAVSSTGSTGSQPQPPVPIRQRSGPLFSGLTAHQPSTRVPAPMRTHAPGSQTGSQHNLPSTSSGSSVTLSLPVYHESELDNRTDPKLAVVATTREENVHASDVYTVADAPAHDTDAVSEVPTIDVTTLTDTSSATIPELHALPQPSVPPTDSAAPAHPPAPRTPADTRDQPHSKQLTHSPESPHMPSEPSSARLSELYRRASSRPSPVSGARKLDVMGTDLLELFPEAFHPHELDELGKFRYIWFCNSPSINSLLGANARHPRYNFKDDYDPIANKDTDFVHDSFTLNNGCDDEQGNYKFDLGRHIEYRYEVISFLGKGSFGQVVKCFDHKRDCIVALKMVRNRKRFQQQALAEIKLLEYLMSAQLCVDLGAVNDSSGKHINPKLVSRPEDGDNADGTGYGEWTSGYRPCFTMADSQHGDVFALPALNHHHIVRVMGYFYFRGHVCLTFEPLSINLYDFLRLNGYKGASPFLVKRIAVQILYTLAYLFQHNIVHCDLKPENILFKAYNPEAGSKAVTVNNAYLASHEQTVPLISTSIKIIDFGSSCFVNESVYTYIQSRFYRAPEIILGAPYSCAIDVWSLGCIVVELFLGYPLFPGDNEEEQMVLLIDTLGVPPLYVQRKGSRSRLYFRSNGEPRKHIVDQLGMQASEALDPEKNKGKTRVNSILRKMLIRYGYNMADPRSQQSPVAHYYRSVRSARGMDPDRWPSNVVELISENEPLMGNLALACLQWDPAMRITPKQALQHRFLTDVDQSCEEFMHALQREMARCVIALNMVAKQ